MSEGAFGAAVYRDRGFRRPRCATAAVLGSGRWDRGARRHGRAAGRPRSLLSGSRCLSRSDGGQALAARTRSDRQPHLCRTTARRRVAEAGDGGNGARVDEGARQPCRVARDSCRRAGAMPAILTGAPLPSPERPVRPEDRDPCPDRPVRRLTDRVHVDTREAAERLGLSPSTLAPIPDHRGGSPCITVSGAACATRRRTLEVWAAGRRGRRNGGVRGGDGAARRTSP